MLAKRNVLVSQFHYKTNPYVAELYANYVYSRRNKVLKVGINFRVTLAGSHPHKKTHFIPQVWLI